MLRLYRPQSAPPAIRGHELGLDQGNKDRLNSAMIQAFSVAELTLLGHASRIKLLHVMDEFIQAREKNSHLKFKPEEVAIAVVENKWILLNTLEDLLTEAERVMAVKHGLKPSVG